MQALQQASRDLPIVFAQSTDPVAAGWVESLAHPGGNTTGFTQFELSFSGKLVELLKEMAPGVNRAAVIRDPRVPAGVGQMGALQMAANSSGVELTAVDVRDDNEMDAALAAFARGVNKGLIVPPSTTSSIKRHLIVELAARHRLPAVYGVRSFVVIGGHCR